MESVACSAGFALNSGKNISCGKITFLIKIYILNDFLYSCLTKLVATIYDCATLRLYVFTSAPR
jgi:hypothetical protein